MSTTTGEMRKYKVTDPQGNVYSLDPVDSEARQQIDDAELLQFDEDYFTADEDTTNKEVKIGLNGVPIGVETPLQFTQDTAQGIVIGLNYSALNLPEMTGATASTDGESGLVPAPEAGDEEKLLTGDGNWTAFDSDVVGTQLLDEHDQPVLDEESTPGNPIYVYDASSTDQLWTGFAGKGFGAIRAYADQDGNNIKETYVKHADVPDMDEASTNDIDAMFNVSGQTIIGGHRYNTVTIGNQEWMAENLDYKFAYNGGTLPLNVDGDPTTPAAWYCQRNEREYGTEGIYNCGLYYNWYAVKYLDDNTATLLSDGWHVATADDWKTLVRTLGYTLVDGSAYCGGVLSAKNNSVTANWPSDWNGTDDYGFNITPCGARAYANTSEWYSRFGLDAYFWTPSDGGEYQPNLRYSVSVYNNGKLQLALGGSSTWTGGYPIRLVRTIS